MVVFTDLDGTLLDYESHSCEAAETALALLAAKGIPLVFCTSKTRAETEEWRKRLHNRHPFAVENGGAVFIPRGYFSFASASAVRRGDYEVLELGERNATLVAVLARASTRSGTPVRAFHDLSPGEVSQRYGIPPELAKLARQREYDEPFEIAGAFPPDRLLAAITSEGRRWTRSDRFFHITGNNDKATAVRLLIGLYRRQWEDLVTVGLGDAPNDAEFLNSVDRPILVRSHYTGQLRLAVPQGTVTRLPGAAGWNEAILGLFSLTDPGGSPCAWRGKVGHF